MRADIAVLKASPYVRNEIPVIGYALDVGSGQLREVRYVAFSFASFLLSQNRYPVKR